eukprot:TRINITY_DN7322_c0_g1_i1.p1 TRINITY_DN7322_c0_g1~~TRINITY_DN7322_c0_g1_i1.p1  ORF type:complete len:492 (-),score=95.57 TRINITY_DN7322_c0_g1_i1:356-1627(-)
MYRLRHKEELLHMRRQRCHENKEALHSIQRRYRLNHKEALLQANRLHRIQKKEVIEEARRVHRRENKVFFHQLNGQYNRENKEERRKAQRLYFLKNKSLLNEKSRQYYLQNKAVIRERQRQRYIQVTNRLYLKGSTPRSVKSWKDTEQIRNFLESLRVPLHITCFSDWYRVSKDDEAVVSTQSTGDFVFSSPPLMLTFSSLLRKQGHLGGRFCYSSSCCTPTEIEDRAHRNNEIQRMYRLRHKEELLHMRRQRCHENKEALHSIQRRYRLNHKEALLQANRLHRIQKKEVIEEARRVHRRENKVFFHQLNGQYNRENKEERRKAQRLYFLKNKSLLNEKSRQYYLQNKAVIRERQRQRYIQVTNRLYLKGSTPRSVKSWKDTEQIRNFLESLRVPLHITCFSDWYRVSKDDICKLGGLQKERA